MFDGGSALSPRFLSRAVLDQGFNSHHVFGSESNRALAEHAARPFARACALLHKFRRNLKPLGQLAGCAVDG